MADDIVVDWKTGLPEELRGDPSIKDVPDVPTLVKAFRDTKAMVGSSIRPPGPDAGPEARAAFREKLRAVAPELVEIPSDPAKFKEVEASIWEKLGAPKDAAGYTLDGVDIPDGVQVPLEDLRKSAAELKLTKAQFQAILKRDVAARTENATKAKALQQELRTEFGLAYDEKMKEAADFAEKSGAPESLRNAIKAGAVDKATVTYLLNMRKAVGGETRAVADQGGSTVVPKLTPAEAEARIEELMARPEYLDKRKNPAIHQEIMRKIAALEAQANPTLARQVAAELGE